MIVLLGVLVGVPLLFPALNKYLASLRIRTSSRDTVESAAKGERVVLQGTAKPYQESLEGPISGDDCLGYVYEVEEYRNTQYGSSWKTIDSGERTVPFLLQADGGTVFVDDENPGLSVEGNQRRERVKPTETPVKRLQELAEGNPNLSEHESGINLSFGGSTGDKRRYTENKLTAEDTVYVRGLGSELSEKQEGAAGSPSLQVGAPDSGACSDGWDVGSAH